MYKGKSSYTLARMHKSVQIKSNGKFYDVTLNYQNEQFDDRKVEPNDTLLSISINDEENKEMYYIDFDFLTDVLDEEEVDKVYKGIMKLLISGIDKSHGNLTEIGFLSSTEGKNQLQNAIFSLALTLESKDSNTYGHSERVAENVLEIAKVLKLEDRDKRNLWRAAMLHDIGKIGIPDVILHKPLSLTQPEWDIMKLHPERGEGICSKLSFAQEVLPIIRHHHERYDGAGYPDGLAGDSIPLLARIVSIADTVDAITSPRSYRAVETMEYAIGELKRCSGTQFDPFLVDAYLDVCNISH